jgi:hypothetical protein
VLAVVLFQPSFGRQVAQPSMHLTLGILGTSQAFSTSQALSPPSAGNANRWADYKKASRQKTVLYRKDVHMTKNKFQAIRFLPGLIFTLVSTICIMAGWQIGTNLGRSNPQIDPIAQGLIEQGLLASDSPTSQSAGQGGVSGGLLGLILGCFFSFGSFGWFTAQVWKRKYLQMKVKHSQMLVFGWMFFPLRGGKMSENFLDEFNSIVQRDIHKKMIKRSMQGFLIGLAVGGTPMCLGLITAINTPFVDLSYQWAILVAIGFSLMGIIGTSIASSALFSDELKH